MSTGDVGSLVHQSYLHRNSFHNIIFFGLHQQDDVRVVSAYPVDSNPIDNVIQQVDLSKSQQISANLSRSAALFTAVVICPLPPEKENASSTCSSMLGLCSTSSMPVLCMGRSVVLHLARTWSSSGSITVHHQDHNCLFRVVRQVKHRPAIVGIGGIVLPQVFPVAAHRAVAEVCCVAQGTGEGWE